jgi:hypothetical protein
MSFTTVDIVRKHLLENHVAVDRIDSEPVKITQSSAARLRYPPVYSGSEKVKAKEQLKPNYLTADFSSSDKVNLGNSDLIRDSVVAASDSSLGTIFKENIDYTVDYETGYLTRLSGGGIPQGGTVSIWYMPYNVYTRGSDYNIDYGKGEIKLIVSGDIESGQWVYVDYTSEYAIIDDEIIINAINEANEQIVNFIDSIYSSSSDRSLVIAETYLSISIICRIKALRNMDSSLRTNSDNSWTTLADRYKRDAFLMLGKFAGSIGNLNTPEKA